MKYLAIFALVLSLGCASASYYRPHSVTGDPEKYAEIKVFANGCAIVTKQADGTIDALIQHAGMSTILAGTLRSVFSVLGSVFGGAAQQQDKLEPHEGCAGVFVTGQDMANGQGNTDAEDDR